MDDAPLGLHSDWPNLALYGLSGCARLTVQCRHGLCNGHGAIADKISACTRLIISGANDATLPDIYRLRGAAYLQNDDIDSAIRDFDEAINRRPDFASAYQNRGVAKFKRGDFDFALADLNIGHQIRWLLPRHSSAFEG